MKKIILSIAASLTLGGLATAKEITPEEALSRSGSGIPAFMVKGKEKSTPRLVHTALTEKGEPAVYVFGKDEQKGFLLLSADDAAIPVLGYSDSGSFPTDSLPPQLAWWLEEYSRQIEYARENNLPPVQAMARKVSRSGERQAIAPMMKTKWDQVAPYNQQCPLSGSERTWTGCVATAMAQVMNYWNYPEKGTGSITYTIETLEKKVTMNFAQKKFDWDNMLDVYITDRYTQEEADAVSYLMKACGYAVKMQYSMDASGALGMNIGNALSKYFGYDGNMLYTLRQYYSSLEWDEMMYDNLLNVGPVIYGGGSTLGGGHSFVCDGYDGEGMYHFNWGWSGMSDGYFSLDALNPNALGTGGGAGGGYNFTQDAVFGIQPPTGEPIVERKPFITQDGELSGKISGTTLHFSLTDADNAMWVNYNPINLKVKFGAMFYPQGMENVKPVYYDVSDRRLSLNPGYGTSPQVLGASINLSKLNLSDGTYKVVCGSVDISGNPDSAPDDGEGFTEIRPTYGLPNYFTLKVENGKYSVTNDLLAPLVVKGEIVGELYYGTLVNFKVTVENPSDVERTSGFAPVFLDDQGALLMGESVCLVIPPKSTITKEWTSSLVQFVKYIDAYLDSELTFTFFDEVNFEYYLDSFSETVVLNSNPGEPDVSVSKKMTIEGSYKEGLYQIIPDATEINVSGELELKSGYFNYPVVVCLGVPVEGGQMEIVNTASQNIYMSTDRKKNRKATYNVTLSYPIAVPGEMYYIALTYQSATGLVPIDNLLRVKFEGSAGIEDTVSQEGINIAFNHSSDVVTLSSHSPIISAEAYDISGRRAGIETQYDGNQATMTLPHSGIYILMVKNESGEIKTVKIAK